MNKTYLNQTFDAAGGQERKKGANQALRLLSVTAPPLVAPPAHLPTAVFIGTILSAYSIIRDGE